MSVTEDALVAKIEGDYRSDFHNIWNPTIAKLGQMYGLQTSMYALWPLLKPDVLKPATEAYEKSPETFNVTLYENPNDKDTGTEPLPLSYKEMFAAIALGCKTEYGTLSKILIKEHLDAGHLIQTSIKLHKLYPGKKHAFHSILLYGYTNNEVFYHDPALGEQLSCTFEQLLTAATDVGACIVFE